MEDEGETALCDSIVDDCIKGDSTMLSEDIYAMTETDKFNNTKKVRERVYGYLRSAYRQAVANDDGTADIILETIVNSELGIIQREIEGWLD